MDLSEVERKIASTALKGSLASFISATVFLVAISDSGKISWVGLFVGIFGLGATAHTVYSRNVEAHYKLSRYLPEEYQTRLNSELESRAFNSLLMTNWFVKLEEELRHKFRRS